MLRSYHTSAPRAENEHAEPRRAARRRFALRRGVRFGLALVLLTLSTACGEKPLATVSTESEAIEMLDVLREGGFEAEKREVGEGETKKWSVLIDEGYFGEGDLGSAIQVLHDHGLPRPEETPLDSGGFMPSETAQRLQEQRRIRTDIERQLRALPGVTSAIVTVVLPPSDQVYRIQPQPATASALVIYKDAKPLFNEQQVQNMVAKSVPELKAENVSVTMSQQTPRPVQRRELSVRRRNNILLAAGIGLVVVLGFVLLVLLLQTRRQRAELTALRETHGALPEADETTPAVGTTGDAPQLPAATKG